MTDPRIEPSLQKLPTLDSPDAAIGPSLGPARGGQAAVEPSAATMKRRSRRRRLRWLILALIALLAIATLVSVLWQPQSIGHLPKLAPRVETPAPLDSTAPRYPIEATAAALPPLDASDEAMLAALQTLLQGNTVASLVEPRRLMRNFVVTVDNLPQRTLAAQYWPLKPVAGPFETASSGNHPVIGDANSKRYTPYVRMLDTADPVKVVALYVRLYPLFQQAYRELGYPQGHFNDRLVEVIDLLLAAPDPQAAIALVQPRVFYEFADRDLEMLPAGQKLMLRMGRDNANTVRARLVELRRILTAKTRQTAASGG